MIGLKRASGTYVGGSTTLQSAFQIAKAQAVALYPEYTDWEPIRVNTDGGATLLMPIHRDHPTIPCLELSIDSSNGHVTIRRLIAKRVHEESSFNLAKAFMEKKESPHSDLAIPHILEDGDYRLMVTVQQEESPTRSVFAQQRPPASVFDTLSTYEHLAKMRVTPPSGRYHVTQVNHPSLPGYLSHVTPYSTHHDFMANMAPFNQGSIEQQWVFAFCANAIETLTDIPLPDIMAFIIHGHFDDALKDLSYDEALRAAQKGKDLRRSTINYQKDGKGDIHFNGTKANSPFKYKEDLQSLITASVIQIRSSVCSDPVRKKWLAHTSNIVRMLIKGISPTPEDRPTFTQLKACQIGALSR